MPRRVSVIIVSWNSREYVRRCVRSALDSAGPTIDVQVILSDNGSHDGTADAIESEFPAVDVVRNGRNLGFSAGVNRGAARATGDYLLLLNSDAELTPSSLEKLVDVLEGDPAAQAAAPLLLRSDGSVQRSALGLPTLEGILGKYTLWRIVRRLTGARANVPPQPAPGSGPVPVEYVIGAVVLLRRALIKDGKVLDEDFFFYFEDTDLCRRIGDAGGKILFCPDISVVHHSGVSSEKNYAVITRVYFRSILTYIRKHHLKDRSAGWWVWFKAIFFFNIVYDLFKHLGPLLYRGGKRQARIRKRLLALMNFLRHDVRPALGDLTRTPPPRAPERAPCVLCQGRAWQHVLMAEDVTYRSVEDKFPLERCLGCGLVSLNPPPDDETLKKAYAIDYEPHTDRGGESKNGSGRLQSFWGFVNPRAGMKILDVGCGSGRVMKRLRDAGCEVWGIEPDADAAEAVRHDGFTVHHGTVEDAPFPPPSFDLISLIHVIEHVRDPIRTLRKVSEFLGDTGRMLVITPNIAAHTFPVFRENWFPLETPRHLHLFSPKTLGDAVRKAGLRVVRIHMTHRSHLIQKSIARTVPPWIPRLAKKRLGKMTVRSAARLLNLYCRDGEEVNMVLAKAKP